MDFVIASDDILLTKSSPWMEKKADVENDFCWRRSQKWLPQNLHGIHECGRSVTCRSSVWRWLRNLFLRIAHYWISAQDAYVLTLIGLTEWDFRSWLLFIWGSAGLIYFRHTTELRQLALCLKWNGVFAPSTVRTLARMNARTCCLVWTTLKLC